MKRTIFIIITIIFPVMAYSGTPDTTYNSVRKEKQEWFEEGTWHNGISAQPDASVDIDAFYDHFNSHTHLWKMVFDYLRKTDLVGLEKGRYELAGDSLFAIVDEYTTQDAGERKYEAHRKYIDLQYIITGQELIGIAGLDSQDVLEPYDEGRDIGFYSIHDGAYRLADSSVFFVFFPDNAHQPCVKAGLCSPVKKIVFKVLMEQ